MKTARTNPDHKWLLDRGWLKAEVIRMGNRIQQRWTHERNGERTYSTEQAIYNEMQEQKRNSK